MDEDDLFEMSGAGPSKALPIALLAGVPLGRPR